MSERYDHDEEQAIERLLIGHSVTVDGDALVLDDGTRLNVRPNEGCGGCDSGWYQIEALNGCENAITAVHFDESDDGEGENPRHFRIFVLAEGIPTKTELLHVAGDDGNGYYGTGYMIDVARAEEGSAP